MATEGTTQVAVRLRLAGRGPGAADATALALAELAVRLSAVIWRVAAVLAAQHGRSEPEGTSRHLADVCAFDLTGIRPGASSVDLGFAESGAGGLQAGTILRCALRGLQALATDGERLPEGYDEGVLEAWQRIGDQLGEIGADSVALELEGGAQRLSATFDQEARRRVELRLQHETRRATVHAPGAMPFDETPSIAELARRQGVRVVDDLDAIGGDFWPEDEDIDDFLAAVRAWRREDKERQAGS